MSNVFKVLLDKFYKCICIKKQAMHFLCEIEIEMFYMNSTLNFGILPVLVFQSEVYYKVDRLLTGIIT